MNVEAMLEAVEVGQRGRCRYLTKRLKVLSGR